MNIQVADVIKVAYDLKIPLTAHIIAYVIANYDNKAEDDPTGALDLWIEQLLYECNDQDHIDFIEYQALQVREAIKSECAITDSSMAEFLNGFKIPQNWNGFNLSNFVVISAINQIIKWDNVPFRYCIKEDDYDWLVYQIDSIDFEGVTYPVRTLKVTHGEDDFEHTYIIAPESMLDAIEEYREMNDDEDAEIDNVIYHYVQDEYFFEDAKYICENHLDIPMKLIEEII